jgi:hypothetical protein
MTDEQTPDIQQQETGNSSDVTLNTETTPQTVPYSRFAEVNRRMRELEKAEADRNAAQRARELEEAAKRGDFEKALSELKPQAERAIALEAALREYLDAEKADVPKEYVDLIPDGDVTQQLAWIRTAKTKGLFTPRTAPKTDAGTRGDRPESVNLSAAEVEIARKMGLTPEQYAKHKQ